MPTNEEMDCSPLPWSTEINDDEQVMIHDANGDEVAQVFTGTGDAELVCRAVNEHNKLINLLGLMNTNLDDAWEYINQAQIVQDKLYDAMDESRKVIMEATLKEVRKVLELNAGHRNI